MIKTFKWIGIALAVLVFSYSLYHFGVYDYLARAWSSSDFRLGVVAELHGVVIETVLVVWLFTWIINRREKKRWKPARLLVARHVCRVHQKLFNSLRWIVDYDHHTNPESHQMPPGTTQRQADAWGKGLHLQPLDSLFVELKKMIEYNNVALDSSLHPKVISYIVAAKDAISICKFVVHAYEGKANYHFHGSYNNRSITEMERIYKDLLAEYPEVVELEKPIGPPPESSEFIHELVESLNSKNEFLHLEVNNNA
ncbi:hypothetical protein [Pelagicoccus mobilis]|uniref:DUF4760 domain-containing protein n=1 Tax=Pelagicoccus mobilis TaxID=415221 RepID=A0A934VP28_9BACT|nr:hypothetical protein [Pelagicoccus mobilis]MBK1880566.1 hypothetical protein [Pelagicoccus mobilis]